MTNFEKWKEELLKIKYNCINYLHPAVVNGKPVRCEGMNCSDCDLNNPFCSDSFIKWLFNEYTEPKKLTRRQRAFCEAVGSGWLARSFSGNVLNFYVNKPKRVDSKDYPYWTTHDDYYFTVNNYLPKFEFIKWKDEPYSIEEMLTWEVEGEA